MTVPMASLTKDRKTGDWVARKGIPADVREEHQRLYGQRWEALFRAKAGTPYPEARRLFTDWLAEAEGRIKTLRDAARGEGRSLTLRERQAGKGQLKIAAELGIGVSVVQRVTAEAPRDL